MKYTGIVRRLDSLGRIVIPREYRKMHKIKESDPLEIIAMENGEILIKKVDISAELITHGSIILSQLYETIKLSVMLSDGEKFLTGHGVQKNQLIDTILPSKIQGLIESRKPFSGQASEVGLEKDYISLYPVASEDCFGAMFIFSSAPVALEDEKILKITANILGEQMQRY